MPNFKIPQSFYLNGSQQLLHFPQTTVGTFCPAIACQSTAGWQGSLPMQLQAAKKIILLTDWTLEQLELDLAQLKLFLLELQELEFTVYIAKKTGICKIVGRHIVLTEFFEIPPQHSLELKEKMLSFGVSADQLLILNQYTLREVAALNPHLYSLQQNKLTTTFKNFFGKFLM